MMLSIAAFRTSWAWTGAKILTGEGEEKEPRLLGADVLCGAPVTRLGEQSRAVTKEILYFWFCCVEQYISLSSGCSDRQLPRSQLWQCGLGRWSTSRMDFLLIGMLWAGLGDGTKFMPFQFQVTSMPSVQACGEGTFAWNAHNGWQSQNWWLSQELSSGGTCSIQWRKFFLKKLLGWRKALLWLLRGFNYLILMICFFCSALDKLSSVTSDCSPAWSHWKPGFAFAGYVQNLIISKWK